MRLRLCLISVLVSSLAAGCVRKADSTLDIYHAGSLSVPFQMLEAAFEARHPGLDVRRRVYGSAMAIRQVTELGSPADLIASADYRLIDRLMIESSPQWAKWNLCFARNAMGIAYGSHSPRLTAENWASVLVRDGIRVGVSNPNDDPCGYRSLMTLYLAQSRLGKAGLFDELVLENSNISLARSGGAASIEVPASVSFRDRLVMRPKETDLVALLQTGAIDSLLIYRSVAAQHGLEFLELPDEVNLTNPDMEELYATASVRLRADRPGSCVEVRGGPILYGVTIPLSARQPDLAAEFVRLILSEEGCAILESCGQEPMRPPTYSSAVTSSERPF